MVQLIIVTGKTTRPDAPAIFGGARLQINHARGAAISVRTDVEQRDVSETFCIAIRGEG